MGKLKDTLYAAVWEHLKIMPKCQTLLTALNHPISGAQTIRTAWSELKNDGRDEGMKSKSGLQSVLAERPDIFSFDTTDRGNQLVGLTEGAQGLSPANGIPAKIPGPKKGDRVLPEVIPSLSDTFRKASMTSEGMSAETAGLKTDSTGVANTLSAALANAGANARGLAERPAKVHRTAKGKGKGGVVDPKTAAFGGNWNGWSFTEKQKEMQLVRAIYRALDMHGGKAVTLSQLGSDFKVAELKKEAQFKNWRLVDILKEYENVFDLVPASGGSYGVKTDSKLCQGVTGGLLVKLHPGAEAALPDAEAAAEHVNEDELLLPERIDSPKGSRERIQALRIELLHALQRRGGRTAIQELGQEPRVQRVKNDLKHQRKLIDWVRLFPENFRVDSQMVVQIVSMDVGDTSMIEKVIIAAEAVGKTEPQADRRNHSCSGSMPYPALPCPGYPPGYSYQSAGMGYGPPAAPPPGLGYGPPAAPPPGYGYNGAGMHQAACHGYPGFTPPSAPPPSPGGYGAALPPQPMAYPHGPPPQPQGYPAQNPPQQAGYPPPGGSMQAGYPPPGGSPQAGYAPPSYPQAGYPPPCGSPQAGYPPPGGNMQAGFPPPGGNMQAGYPPPGGNMQAGYPPPDASMQAGYPPPDASMQAGYPPPGGSMQAGYPPPGGSAQAGYAPPSYPQAGYYPSHPM